MNKVKFFLILVLFSIPSVIFSYNENDLGNLRLGERSCSKMDLSMADLFSENLWCVDLANANLTSANLKSVNIRSANFKGASLINANLKYAVCNDLTNFEEASVRGADFMGVIGLSEKQRKYLVENGAINVPESDEHAVKQYKEEVEKGG